MSQSFFRNIEFGLNQFCGNMVFLNCITFIDFDSSSLVSCCIIENIKVHYERIGVMNLLLFLLVLYFYELVNFYLDQHHHP